MIRTLDRKLLRDLWSLRGQLLAIALVIASGVTTLIMSLSTLDSLRGTRASYYERNAFADAFATLKRAPEALRRRVEEIPGVEQVETRVVASAKLEIDGYQEPVTGLIVSLPEVGEPRLNRLFLRRGRLPESVRSDEVVVSESFAEAHGFLPGDHLGVVINGRREWLTIVGLALSPEYIYQLSPGSIIPDFERFGILWMRRNVLEVAYDMEGAFNDLVLALTPGASVPEVVERLDDLLERYGGLGAHGRKDQTSHRYLSSEFDQLGQMSRIFPTIFLAVAAFLLNVVVSRVISTQREQIAALKAFGYSSLQVGIHYTKLVAVVSFVGSVLGIIAGVWLGQGMAGMYMKFYKFPYLEYVLRPEIAALGILVTGAATLTGTIFSVRRAALLPPAEAMRPEPPARYHVTVAERLGLGRFLAQPTRMVLRNLERRPVKTLLSTAGVAFSCAILLMGSFFNDAVDFMMEVQFGWTQREDIAVTFVEPTSRAALDELVSLPGVQHAEAYRAVPVRMRFQHHTYRTSVQGLQPGGELYRLLDTNLDPIPIPSAGILLTEQLGKILGVGPGDRVTLEVLEGSRPHREVLVVDLVREFIGLAGYMELSALNRLLREGHAISGAYLAADARYQESIYEALRSRPRVAATTIHANAVQSFRDTMAEQVLIFAFFNTILAGTIAFGVVYNNARISLSERSRELASLRVLGFTRGEISYILLGELAVITLASLPLGFVVGHALCAYMVAELPEELFRIPLVVEPSTYAFSALVVLISATISGLLVRRKLDHLDLIAVLKAKE